MALIEQLQIIGQAAIMSAVYSAVFYTKNRQKSNAAFDPKKFAATLIVGIGVGVSIALGGGRVFRGAIETQLAGYAGVVALLETVLKLLYRQWKGVTG